MQSDPEHEERSRGLGHGTWIKALVRHVAQDFLGDAPIFANGTFRLKDRQDRFEGIVEVHPAPELIGVEEHRLFADRTASVRIDVAAGD